MPLAFNDLTLALAALGAVVLAAILAHGLYTARVTRPKRSSAPPAEPVEPVLIDTPATPSTAVAATHDPGMPVLEVPPPRRYQARIDALIDAIAVLRLEAPVSAEMLAPHLPSTRRAGSKPFLVEGLNARTGEWEGVTPGQQYGELQAAVQLANRGGPLNEIEYSEFVQKVQGFADAIGAMVELPDMLDVVARARELDTFAGQHDAQLALQLRSRGAAWSIGYLQQRAGQHGFVPGALPGRLVLASAEDGAPPVLTLAYDSAAALADDPQQAALRVATLAFDVPQTDAAEQPFAAWQRSGQALVTALDAAIVDDNGQPFGDPAFAGIGGELERLYQALAARDLPAGSMAARRLFS
ncbi:MAG: cell division protein FtsZ [Burkholderiaceae bacterium]